MLSHPRNSCASWPGHSPTPNTKHPHPRTWYEKFRDAFRGVRSGMRGQSSFRVHIFVAIVVIVAAALLRCTTVGVVRAAAVHRAAC